MFWLNRFFGMRPWVVVWVLCGLFTSLFAEELVTADVDVIAAEGPTRMELLDDEWALKVGDRLIYQVLEEGEDPVFLSVNGEGDLLVPLIGTVDAEGKTSRVLAYEIKGALEEDFFHRATVMITQREEDRNRGRITLIGEVKRPGEQLIPADAPLTLSQAILQGGGFTLYADRNHVSVVSEGQSDQAQQVNVGQMHESGDFSMDVLLQPGDVILVSRADQMGDQIYVLGAVESPGLYSTLGNRLTLSQAILLADGFTRFAKKSKVRLISSDAEGERVESLVNVSKILDGGDRSEDPVVKPGDMIIVEEKMISFSG